LELKFLQELGTQKAPALERLELDVSEFFPISIEHVVGHSFFKRPLPKLRILYLSQILFPWSLVPRGQLTQLIVSLDRETSIVNSKVSQHDDLDQLIGLLVDCPSLEVLTLENCLPAMLSNSSGGEQTIHLPRLSRLCLGGSNSRIMNLLKMLKLSSPPTLRLNCTSNKTVTHNRANYEILPFLSTHFNGPTPVKFRSLEINAGRVIDMVASTSLPMSSSPYTHVIQTDSDAELSLSFYRVVKLNRADIPRRVCDVLCLSNLDFLSVHSGSPNQSKNWSEVFQHCTEVTTVQVHGCGTIGLLQALTPPKLAITTACGRQRERKGGDNGRRAWAEAPRDDDNHGPAPVHVPIFPKLTSLTLESLDFTDAIPGFGVLYDLVLRAVQWRKANKTPLTTLWIERCVISEEQASALEKLVSGFQWHHVEGYYPSKEGDSEDYSSELGDSGDDHSDTSDPGVQ